MKTTAAEYFTSITPLKSGWCDGGNLYEQQNGRSGRCHCCPYGYHIDLDFVRYCETVTQGSKNDNPTLRQLKKLKRARRRQTKSMEVLLGLEPALEAINQHQQQTKLEIIEEPQKSSTTWNRQRTPPPPPPRRSRSPLLMAVTGGGMGGGGPPPDVINSIASRVTTDQTIRNNIINKHKSYNTSIVDPGDALQEAVLDFEEMLESSRDKKSVRVRRSDTLPPSFPPSLDLLHHTPPAHSGVRNLESVKSGATVTRSHSLPRTFYSRPLYPSPSPLYPSSSPLSPPSRPYHTPTSTYSTPEDHNRMAVLMALRRMWNKSVINNNTHTTLSSLEDSPILGRHRTSSVSSVSSLSSAPQNNSPSTNGMGVIQQGWAGRCEGGGGRLADTLTALNLGRGCYSPALPPQDFDTMSMSSAVSGVSTTTLQSIRDQMATSLARLKDLEEEVKTIPKLQIKVNVLTEEKRLLLDQIRALRRGENPPAPLLPPSLDPDLSEEELEGRLASIRTAALSAAHSAANNSRQRRQRSQSPLRVNLEEFRSYRRARRGSLSEGSETESGGEDGPLHISEPSDRRHGRRRSLDESISANRAVYSLPATPATRRRSRDAATNCRVVTRDVGISHVGVRTRSVGVTAGEWQPEDRFGGCQQCRERSRRSVATKCVGTPPEPQSEDKLRRLSQTSVSLESVRPEEAVVEDDGSHKSSFLRKLGRKSAIISRLSEPQLTPPPLTFDNSTNTEPLRTRNQSCTTTISMEDVVPRKQVSKEIAQARAEWETASANKERLRKLAHVKPLTLDAGVQTSEAAPNKTIFRPLMQSVGCQSRPLTTDMGVGVWRLTDTWCDKCASVSTRSVGCGTIIPPNPTVATIPTCQRCTSLRTRTVGSGDHRLDDTVCQRCAITPSSSRNVGCATDPLPGCQRCATHQTRTVGIGTAPPHITSSATQTRPPPATPVLKTTTTGVQTRPLPVNTHSVAIQTRPVTTPATKTVSTGVQTRAASTVTAGVNTAPLGMRKDELINETGTGTPSPAGTPEVERRPFGTVGVRVCDKCHEAITTLAQDIVGTTGPPPPSSLPPLPPHTSRIPRLVVEPPRIMDSPQPPDVAAHLQSQIPTVAAVSPTRPVRGEKPLKPATPPHKPATPPHKPATPPPPTTTETARPAIPSKPATTTTKSPTKTSTSGSKAEMGSWWQNTATSNIAPVPTAAAAPSDHKPDPPSATSSTSSSITSSPQTKRVPYSRQNTYTKYSEGVVNMAFDPHAKAEDEASQRKGSAGSAGGLPRIAEGDTKKAEDKKPVVSKKPEVKKEVKEEDSRKKSTESEPATHDKPKEEVKGQGGGGGGGEARGVRGRTVSISSCDSATDTEEEGGSVVGGGSLASHLDIPTSSFHSVSSLATATSERSRKKSAPSREMKAALKVLNDSLGKPVRSGQQLTNALNIIQKEWFKISSGKEADPHAVEDYMDVFEDYSKALLQRVVNLSDVNGNTAMHYAVSHGNFDVVSILLDSRVCNVNQQNKAGYTAAMLVSLALIRTEVHTGVVQRLFQMADVNIKASQHGQTALMLAVSHGRLDMVKLLVGAGADVNIHDEDGSTALMCAAEHGHLPIVGFLLNLPDTDPTLMDHDGSTALTIAVEAGHKDVGVLLYKHMNLSRGSSPYSSVRIKRSRTPTLLSRPSTTPPRSSAPSSPGRSRKSSAPASPGPNPRHNSASLSNLIL